MLFKILWLYYISKGDILFTPLHVFLNTPLVIKNFV